MISFFKQERDSEGREVVEIGMNAMLFQISAIAGPLVLLVVAYFVIGRGPLGMPWYLIVGPIALGVIAYPVVLWMCRRSKVRVTIDSKAGKLIVGTSAGQSEIRVSDLAKAEFTSQSDSEGTTLYRLEFIMRDGGRVPATTMYTNAYSLGDQAKAVAAINAALRRQMA